MYTNDPSEKTAALRQAKKLSDIGTTDPRYFLTKSGYSFMASDIEQNITPADFNSSLKVVPTETLSKTASTATLRFSDLSSGFSSITPASFFCSVNGIPSFE